MQHAGSSSKSAAKYIRFENGKNFCEILNACKRAPLDILESTIKSAICLSSLKEDSARQNCKGEEFNCPWMLMRLNALMLVCYLLVKLKASESAHTCNCDCSFLAMLTCVVMFYFFRGVAVVRCWGIGVGMQ